MRIKNQILAGVMAASIIFTSVPAVNVSAAKLKYTGIYTKEIDIDKDEQTASNNSAGGSSGSDSAKIVGALATSDNASVDTESTTATDSNNASTTGSSQDNATVDTSAAPANGNSQENATVAPSANSATTVVAMQEEKVRVMTGMKFVIGINKDGTLVQTKKNKSKYKFRSSNKKIAKVSAKGIVTTVKAGKCDITITDKSDGSAYVMHLTVAKTVKVKSIKLNETEKTFKKLDRTFQLEYTVKPAKYDNVPVLWGSTNASVAAVDDRGLVSIKGYGNCEIYCKAGSNNKVAKCTVKVTDPNSSNNGGGNTGYNKLTYRTGKLVDISSHNTVSNWQQLKNSCDGVIIRVGYRGYSGGTLQEDIKFRSNVYNCQQHGIPFSVYFFTTAVNETEGAEEANWIANELAGMNISMPVFIDTESSGTGSGRSDNLSKGQRTAAVKAACAQLSARGIPAGVYASTYWLYNNIDMGQLPYSVWAADYRGYCGYSGAKFAWQYTSSATGYGVANRCDVSNWYN